MTPAMSADLKICLFNCNSSITPIIQRYPKRACYELRYTIWYNAITLAAIDMVFLHCSWLHNRLWRVQIVINSLCVVNNGSISYYNVYILCSCELPRADYVCIWKHLWKCPKFVPRYAFCYQYAIRLIYSLIKKR